MSAEVVALVAGEKQSAEGRNEVSAYVPKGSVGITNVQHINALRGALRGSGGDW